MKRETAAATRGYARALLPLAMLLTQTGCSAIVASLPTSSVPEHLDRATRADIRRELGEPATSTTNADDTGVDTYDLHRPIERPWKSEYILGIGALGVLAIAAAVPLYLTAETIATAATIHSYSTQIRHLAFVYQNDDRLLVLSESAADPRRRATLVLYRRDAAIWEQLRNGECPSWSKCIEQFIDARRKISQLPEAPPAALDEENIERLRSIARDRDDLRISAGAAYIAIAGRGDEDGVSSSRRFLVNALRRHLDSEACPRWVECVTAYVDELGRRAESPAAPSEHWSALLALAHSRDDGQLTSGEALEQIEWSMEHVEVKNVGIDLQ